MNTIDSIEQDITSLKIQGATNVALAVLSALENNPSREIGIRLAYARPTEPLAQNAVRFVFSGNNPEQRIKQFKTLIEKSKTTITDNGTHLLVDGGVYLTLCHSSTTVRLFESARKKGANFSLYVAETRPRFQGRITATELLDAGFEDVTMIIDDVAISLIEGRKGKIDAVFIGADLLTPKGFVNKVGSLAIAVAANRKNIPVYVLTTLLKFNPEPYSPSMIEMRNPDEIWVKAPKNLRFYAPAFDYVPYMDNINVVCEEGVIPATLVEATTRKRYPWLTYGKSI